MCCIHSFFESLTFRDLLSLCGNELVDKRHTHTFETDLEIVGLMLCDLMANVEIDEMNDVASMRKE